VDYRPKTNAVILLDMGHKLRVNAYRRNREREGKLKLEKCLMCHCRGANKVILNW
jgi:hypothetical protein